MFGQQLVNGLTMGSIYALIAIGVSMIYKSLGMLNVAHGDTIMLSAFVALTLYDLGIPLVLTLLLTFILMGLFGLLLERFIYRKLEYSSFTNLLIATISASICSCRLSRRSDACTLSFPPSGTTFPTMPLM